LDKSTYTREIVATESIENNNLNWN